MCAHVMELNVHTQLYLHVSLQVVQLAMKVALERNYEPSKSSPTMARRLFYWPRMKICSSLTVSQNNVIQAHI